MTWSERVVDSFEPSDVSSGPSSSLTQKVDALISGQSDEWPMLRARLEGFKLTETRIATIGGTASQVVIQHNPGRIRSTAAKVDAGSISARKCFLCPENMPDEEKGIAYGSDLIITCNPFPVLERHLSIVHRRHVEQKIDGNLELLLSLARDLGPEYFVLYNGPRAGASAPDHLHFQACSRSVLPIEQDYQRSVEMTKASAPEREFNPRTSHSIKDCGRTVFVFVSDDKTVLESTVYNAIRIFQVQIHSDTEPMLNIVVTYDHPRWTVYLFPRAKHRPSHFFAEGNNRLTISPGAVDMAGIIVVPNSSDYARINGNNIREIFGEVTLDRDVAREIFDQINIQAI